MALLCCGNKYGVLPLVLLVGLVTNVPSAVLVKLGQDCPLSRPGTAAGVTFGLAVSASGLFMPLLGPVADQRGPRASSPYWQSFRSSPSPSRPCYRNRRRSILRSPAASFGADLLRQFSFARAMI